VRERERERKRERVCVLGEANSTLKADRRVLSPARIANRSCVKNFYAKGGSERKPKRRRRRRRSQEEE
jgi:hypothetical protein